MKVGGRRLSISSRPKPHNAAYVLCITFQLHHTPLTLTSTPSDKSPSPKGEEPADYPRPAGPGDDAPHNHEPHDEVPKKEKKRGSGGDEHERRLQESLYRKAEQNRPRKDFHGAKNLNAVGAGGRIAQPMGRQMSL